MSVFGEEKWRADQRFPKRMELGYQFRIGYNIFLYVIPGFFAMRMSFDYLKWRTLCHLRQKIKEGERLHYWRIQRQALLEQLALGKDIGPVGSQNVYNSQQILKALREPSVAAAAH